MPLTPFEIPPASHLIGGSWIRGDATIQVTDPSTGQPLTQIARGTAADIDAAVAAAHATALATGEG